MATKILFPTLGEIRTRAYQIYLARGCKPGHDQDDWLQAEYELMKLPLHKIAEREARCIESNVFRIFNLARVALTLEKKPSKCVPPLRNRPTVSSPPGMASSERSDATLQYDTK